MTDIKSFETFYARGTVSISCSTGEPQKLMGKKAVPWEGETETGH